MFITVNNTKSNFLLLKGITIALVITILIYTSFYLLMNWDYHSQTMKGRFLGYGELPFFIGIWFIHSCYCSIYEFITDAKKECANYGFLVIPLFGIISIVLPENYGIKFILGFSMFSLPCTILIRNITGKIYKRIEQVKNLSLILDWKLLYSFYIVSCIILYYYTAKQHNSLCFDIDKREPIVPYFQSWVIIYWWILGIVTLLITLYHLYSNHWKNGILIGLLMIFWGLFTCLYL